MKWTNKGHQYDEIGKRFAGVNRIYLYGAGTKGGEALRQLAFSDVPITFVDRDDEKQCLGFCGHNVISPAQLYREHTDVKSIVILTMDTYFRAKRNLLSMGWRDGVDVFDWNFFNEFYIHIFAMYRHEKLHINNACEWITTKCTLNCRNCCQFINFLPRENKSFDQVIDEIDTFFSLVDFLNIMYMQGGEITIHPDCIDSINYIYDKYSSRFADLIIFTNGLWPASLDRERLLTALKRPKVHIYWSDYSENIGEKIRVKIHENIEFLHNNGIDVIHIKPAWVDLGNGEFEEHSEDWHTDRFNDCCVSSNPHENKFAHCTQSYEWARRIFGLDYRPHIEKDWISLKNDGNPLHKHILLETYLGFTESGYTEMCGYCRGWLGVNNTSIPTGVQQEVAM